MLSAEAQVDVAHHKAVGHGEGVGDGVDAAESRRGDGDGGGRRVIIRVGGISGRPGCSLRKGITKSE